MDNPLSGSLRADWQIRQSKMLMFYISVVYYKGATIVIYDCRDYNHVTVVIYSSS
jgi:hypothetical protein